MKNNWINSPILNRSGLAAAIWSDKKPNELRRRLEQKAKRDTLNEEEKKKIIVSVENFLKQIKECLS